MRPSTPGAMMPVPSVLATELEKCMSNVRWRTRTSRLSQAPISLAMRSTSIWSSAYSFAAVFYLNKYKANSGA